MSDPFPGIKRAALLIALDNGGINRGRSQRRMLREFEAWLARHPNEILPPIDAWLSGLSEADIDTVCAGEQGEAAAILKSAPPFSDKLLNDYFNEVC